MPFIQVSVEALLRVVFQPQAVVRVYGGIAPRRGMLPVQVSVEAALRVVFQPQAVFRVRPVSRCTASIAGVALRYTCSLK